MRYLLLFVFGLLLSNVWAQFPPLEMSADNVQTLSQTTVEVLIRAGSNWQNITQFRGTITFDTTIVTWDQVSFIFVDSVNLKKPTIYLIQELRDLTI